MPFYPEQTGRLKTFRVRSLPLCGTACFIQHTLYFLINKRLLGNSFNTSSVE